MGSGSKADTWRGHHPGTEVTFPAACVPLPLQARALADPWNGHHHSGLGGQYLSVWNILEGETFLFESQSLMLLLRMKSRVHSYGLGFCHTLLTKTE